MSGYLERAKRIHTRGDVVSSAFLLVDGLKRDPHNAEALEWLMHLYVREMPRPGVEQDLLLILHQQPNGGLLFSKICARLEEGGGATKLEAMRRAAIARGEPRDFYAADDRAADTSDTRESIPERAPLNTPVPSDDRVMPAPSPKAEQPHGEDWSGFASPLEGASNPRATGTHRPLEGRSVGVAAVASTSRDDADDTVLLDAPARSPGVDRSRIWLAALVGTILLVLAVAMLLMPRGAPQPAAELAPSPGSGAAP